MKTFLFAGFAFFLTADLAAQVVFRNDFVINRKQRKIENLGLTFISINLGNHPNWNQLINGRGGRALVIDVRSMRQGSVEYTYSELAEKVYTPNLLTGPIVRPVPVFLLAAPPHAKIPIATYRSMNLPSQRLLQLL